jgi:hypothetical protein
MTDLEISKALALAIGWTKDKMILDGSKLVIYCVQRNQYNQLVWMYEHFDYRDWRVIGPIAEKFDCFPSKIGNHWAAEYFAFADTPQKAIALAVIGAKK